MLSTIEIERKAEIRPDRHPIMRPKWRYCVRLDRTFRQESLWSLCHRFCLLNVISGQEFKSEFRRYPIDRRDSVTYLNCSLAGFNHEKLVAALGGEDIVFNARDNYTPARFITRSQFPALRFCPRCIEIGVHLNFHQSRWVAACPMHGDLLRTRCPKCGFEILLKVPGPKGAFSCDCGHKLWAPVTVKDFRLDSTVRAELVKAAQWFEQGCKFHSTLGFVAAFPNGGDELHHRTTESPYHWSSRNQLTTIWALLRPKGGILPNNFDTALGKRFHQQVIPIPQVAVSSSKPAEYELGAASRAIYKSICRHLYRRVLRRHRQAIRSIASFPHDQGGARPRGIRLDMIFDPAAQAFALWKAYWEWRHIDELFRPGRREITWKWARRDDERYDVGNTSELDDTFRGLQLPEAIEHRMRAEAHFRILGIRCIATFEEIAARIEATQQTRSVDYLNVCAIDERYVPTVVVQPTSDTSLVISKFYPADSYLASGTFRAALAKVPSKTECQCYARSLRRSVKRWTVPRDFRWPENPNGLKYFLDGPSITFVDVANERTNHLGYHGQRRDSHHSRLGPR